MSAARADERQPYNFSREERKGREEDQIHEGCFVVFASAGFFGGLCVKMDSGCRRVAPCVRTRIEVGDGCGTPTIGSPI